ncbi:amino acid transporter [Ramicandelaber brevisporus]|nr:amino acid transporter [Ramicandelaber brevisporus]
MGNEEAIDKSGAVEHHSDGQVVDELESDQVPRTIGVLSGAAIVAGSMIGSGIFSLPASVAALVGGVIPGLLIWVVGGIMSFAGALCYAELGASIPRVGAEVPYLQVSYPHPQGLLPFMFSFAMNFCTGPATNAAVATAFGKYLLFSINYKSVQEGIPNDPWVERALGAGALIAVAALNSFSTLWSARVNVVLTTIKIITLLVVGISGLVILFGWTSVPRQLRNFQVGFSTVSNSPQQFASALFSVLFATSGWYSIGSTVNELKNPQRNLPRAIAGGTAIVIILYLLANVAVFTVVPLESLGEHNITITGEYATIVFGTVIGHIVLPIFISLSCLGALISLYFAYTRYIVAAGIASYMPFSSKVAQVHPRLLTPVAANIMHCTLALLYLFAPPPGVAFNTLVDLSGYPQWVYCGITVLGMLILRRREPNRNRPVQTWSIFAYIFILATICLAVFPFVPPSKDWRKDIVPFYAVPVAGCGFIIAGAVLYFTIKKMRPNWAALHYTPL